MIDLRIYRLSFLPALAAVVVLMFSLAGAPDPIEAPTPPATFEGDAAAADAREIVRLAPDRTAGGPGDAVAADLVAERFSEIPAGAVSEQSLSAEIDGEEVALRNVVLTLPGDAERAIVVLAARDAETTSATASSAAATGVLLELARALGVSGHDKTLVLASVSGTAAGAAGAVELLESLPERDSVEAVLVVSQPGSASPSPPYVVTTSTAARNPPVQLERSVELAVESQTQRPSPEPGWFEQLARLAIPSGLGAQAPLIARAVPAVRISSSGERGPSPSADTAEGMSGASIDAFGRATQSAVTAIDATATPLAAGPNPHLELGENLVPGWTLALLALALVLPAGIAAVDGLARASRGGEAIGGALLWAAARALPFLGALAGVYGLALVGAIPRPPFPFDPSRFEHGTRASIVLIALALIVAASAFAIRRAGITGGRARQAAIPALGAISVAAVLALWLANPYLALLAVPAAHVWLVAAGEARALRVAAVAVAAVLAIVPATLAWGAVASALELGGDGPWTLLLMLADGQIGVLSATALCFLGGGLIGAIAIAYGRYAHASAGARRPA